MTGKRRDNTSSNYTIALQPIVDCNLKHVADELLYRGHINAQEAVIVDDVQATARACAVSVYEIGLNRLCGPRKLFINVSEQWLLNPDLHALPTEQVVLEVLETTPDTEEIKRAMHHLSTLGYTLALDDFLTDQNHESLLDYCKIVKVDVTAPITAERIASLKSRGLTLLAERVETRADFEKFKSLGFSLFQGYFYERPIAQKSRDTRRSSTRANQLKLIAKLYQTNLNITDINALVAQDPYLVDAVLRRANSACKGLSQPSYKLKECIQRIGLHELKMLVTVVLLADNHPANRLNLINGLTRALACGQLAGQRQLDEEEGFILGLFSHMPTILGVEASALIDELPFEDRFLKALIERKGQLGSLLDDIEFAEKGRFTTDLPDSLLVEAAAQARTFMDEAWV